MTQALNLALFANNLNTSGATTNAGLQNSAVTVTAGTGMSGGGAVSLGSAVTLTNAGVTSLTGAGNVTVSASTGAVTITGTGGSGTVTSVATGNGLSGGTITSTGTLTIAAPTFNSVGSYCAVALLLNVGSTVTSGNDYSAGTGNLQVKNSVTNAGGITQNNLTGIWRWMGPTYTATGDDPANLYAIAVKVS